MTARDNMHELSIALSILDAVEEQAEQHAGARIVAVHLKLGPLSGVVKEALVSAYGLAREGTPFAACDLVIEDVPITVFCPRCEGRRLVESMQERRCVECGTFAAKVLSGEELEVSAMEIEE